MPSLNWKWILGAVAVGVVAYLAYTRWQNVQSETGDDGGAANG